MWSTRHRLKNITSFQLKTSPNKYSWPTTWSSWSLPCRRWSSKSSTSTQTMWPTCEMVSKQWTRSERTYRTPTKKDTDHLVCWSLISTCLTWTGYKLFTRWRICICSIVKVRPSSWCRHLTKKRNFASDANRVESMFSPKSRAKKKSCHRFCSNLALFTISLSQWARSLQRKWFYSQAWQPNSERSEKLLDDTKCLHRETPRTSQPYLVLTANFAWNRRRLNEDVFDGEWRLSNFNCYYEPKNCDKFWIY